MLKLHSVDFFGGKLLRKTKDRLSQEKTHDELMIVHQICCGVAVVLFHACDRFRLGGPWDVEATQKSFTIEY